MFDLSVDKSKQAALIAGLKKHPGVKFTSETDGRFSHRSGLQVEFYVAGNGVHVTVVENPEDVPEEVIKERFTDDVEAIIHLMT